MKIILQAFIGSIIIHIIYTAYTIMGGYIKTKYYNPDIPKGWETVDVLQNEVAFGMIISPYFFLYSILSVTVICAIILFAYEKLFKKKVSTSRRVSA
ncbi:hypothetical protein OR571_19125 [Psychrobacillus sp. NEAU-3TGS]|uniref:hypothetical protein n=1 Tax=Psychrobacillus sp. NEAU-3TGS TaxID=2995412 RepID=UPI0024973520|nr:hypothetical protein [Psychrobacillus sp. NEAU-3TGS]MDI2589152.1 hypothetical protein [Psychrobacillus sp. NEAU-3TGS]